MTNTRGPSWFWIDLCIGIAVAMAYLVGYLQHLPVHHPGCKTEDEVPVYVAHKSYDLDAGLPQCVHIDNIKDPR